MVGVAGPGSSAIQAVGEWQSKVTIIQQTPEMKARMAEADRRIDQLNAVDKEYKDVWAKKASGDTGMQLGEVSKQSPQQAANNLAAMIKLRDMYGENGLQVSAMRGDEKTTSFSTYISWLQARAGAAQVNDLTQASLFSLKV